MSAAKHQPATPLPLKVAVANDLRIIHSGNPHDRVATLRGPKADERAAYIAHAANAYPKLVEALRLAAVESMNASTRKTCTNLLRELGEAE